MIIIIAVTGAELLIGYLKMADWPCLRTVLGIDCGGK